MTFDEESRLDAAVTLVEQRFVHYVQWGQLVKLVIWTLLKDVNEGNALPPKIPLEQIHKIAACLPMAGPNGELPPDPYQKKGSFTNESS
jgi:hypothetical protein